MTKKSATKYKRNEPTFYVNVAQNIEKSVNGSLYRVRKCIDGVKYCETFDRMRDARKYLKNL